MDHICGGVRRLHMGAGIESRVTTCMTSDFHAVSLSQLSFSPFPLSLPPFPSTHPPLVQERTKSFITIDFHAVSLSLSKLSLSLPSLSFSLPPSPSLHPPPVQDRTKSFKLRVHICPSGSVTPQFLLYREVPSFIFGTPCLLAPC